MTVEIEIDVNKSVEENAARYYEAVKKFRRKRDGAEQTLKDTEKKLEKLKEQEEIEEERQEAVAAPRKKAWFEKFRWFYSSEGYLCIGGRDATTNEILIKKHTEPHETVTHTDMAGSPFFVIKSGEEEAGDASIREAADATITFSKAWGRHMVSGEVSVVKGEQVTKEAQSGEFLAKGSFVIKGKTEYMENSINLAIGIYEGAVMAGPVSAISHHCADHVEVVQGDRKASDTAKAVRARIGGDLDEIIRALPPGGSAIKKR